MPMTYAYDEATLDLLRLTIPTYGILVPIIQQSGTNEIIDGRHRLKVREELEAKGTRIMLPVHHVDTNNPEEIDQIVNSVRRPWQDAEQRRELVSKLREKGHSPQRIADSLGASRTTVRRDLDHQVPDRPDGQVGTSKPKPTTGKDGKTKLPPATPEEVARAWAMLDAGKGKKEIAAELGRGYSTVREWFKKERPEAVQQGQPTSTPSAPEPTRTPSVPSAESSAPIQWADHPRLKGWNGVLNDEAQRLYKREVASSRSRVRMAEQLAKFKLEVEKSMRAASKNHRVKAGALLETDVAMVEAALQRENRPGIKETLEAVIHESERIQKYANETLRILQLRQIDERGIAKT